MFDGLNKDMESCMRKFDSMMQHVSQVLTMEIAIEVLCFSDSVDVNGFQDYVDLQSEYGESTSSGEIDVVETSETKLPSIEDGLKDVDTSLDDHGHIRHSGPSHQVSGSSPLEHEEQCRLNSSRIDFTAASKIKLSSIEGSSRNVFQDQKDESSDDSRVRDDETKDTKPITDEMSEGSICNDRQHGAATATASVPS
ncbi:OLC1v1001445C1 [Oldenlandia corymbosa var. corymbosa]|uniref:OLC1v1001445C1 n=1 Tax=Oldenlandia corymbosa var. corymbosa TaxID=529605 RepID=A0AAV1D5B1_OLDCO|nr:OLC1v1001445C1 [Oldenlandia corymbosa var. corymbosa]